MPRSTRDALRTLTALAQTQGGYFTAKQAAEAGYDYPHLVYHVSAGNCERVGHGLYRLNSAPISEHDDLIWLTLWSRNQRDEPQAVASHQTALALHELSEVMPDRVHMTVPTGFRKPAPKVCVLHRGTLAGRDVEDWAGFRVTKPLRTLLDVAGGEVSLEQLEKAVADALRQGLVSRAALEKAAETSPHRERLRFALGG